jgi:type IV secretion system protein VirB8
MMTKKGNGPMEAHGFDVDLVLEPRLSARRAWMVATGAGVSSLLLATALVLVLPLRETQVFTVLVDRQTGDAENVLQVAPTGIEDQEALKQSLLVAYISDREGYFLPGIQARLESVQRRSTAAAEESLRILWSKGGGNTAYPPDVYGPGAEVTVTVRRITFLTPTVAQVRFLKTLRQTKQTPITQPFVATVEFAFAPKTERSLAHVWENPLGFIVSAYRVDAETLEANP